MGRTPVRAALTDRASTAAAGAVATASAGGRGRAAARAAVLGPAGVAVTLGLWGLDRGSMWRDEGATFQVARRSVPEILRLLGSVDAVHGLYYLLMHAVLAVRADEVTLRLPSVAATACTAALVGALGSRLARPRVGLWAGLLYAVNPFVGRYAQEGRSYALVAAGAALATLLLVRAAERGSAARWCGYGAVVMVSALLHEFAVLLLPAHALTLFASRVPWRTWRGWGCAALAACAAVAPLAVFSRGQSGQVSWIRTPGSAEAKALVLAFAGPSDAVLAGTLALAAVALLAPLPRTGPPAAPRLPLHAVALPLALVPPVLLYAASQSTPVFLDRYLLFGLAGVPLLAAAGAERLLGFLPRRGVAVTVGVAAIAASFLWQLPVQQRERLPASRGDEPARVAAVVGRLARPGDAVLFLPHHERRISLMYPRDFTGLRDLTLGRGAAASGTLYGEEADSAELRRRLARLPPGTRVWVVWDTTTVGGRWFRAQRAEYAKSRVLGELCREEGATVYVRGGAVTRYSCRPGQAGGISGVPAAPPASPPPASLHPTTSPPPPSRR
ncbi:glycosyltransferase family 39 protein [Streptomyces sp. AV19]|uniref:glycosyltransferase family 39 protein n=1 Tax=Streptomyces sp. AV19 TaxID=2793068 RepID=UPI0018FED5D9|nr:glycosyltransferase family 39 protein [Streptomyces sp. AV19]MBH1932745.1 glycosyltransferase family 39 protein [Streptomyces sp. AV19]MDG4531416.1 glycosyltransferase family 39 protein [Streptomyces sp. AV19]